MKNDMVYFGQQDGDKPLRIARVCNDGYELGIGFSHGEHMELLMRYEEWQELLPFIRKWLAEQPWRA